MAKSGNTNVASVSVKVFEFVVPDAYVVVLC